MERWTDSQPISLEEATKLNGGELTDEDIRWANLWVCMDPTLVSSGAGDPDWSGLHMELRCTHFAGEPLPDDQHLVLAQANHAHLMRSVEDYSAESLVYLGDGESHDLYMGALGIQEMMRILEVEALRDQEEALGSRIDWLHMGTVEVPERLRGRRLSWLLLHHAIRMAGRGAVVSLSCGLDLKDHWISAGAPFYCQGDIDHKTGDPPNPWGPSTWLSKHIFSSSDGPYVECAVVYNHIPAYELPQRCEAYSDYMKALRAAWATPKGERGRKWSDWKVLMEVIKPAN